MHRYDEAIENYSLAIELTREVKDFGSNVEAQYVAMYCNLFSAVSRRKIGFLGTRDEETSMYNSLICFPVGDDLRTRLLPLPLRSSFGM
jgi:hypothetical protein